jgi:hypothetical protein
MVWLLWVYTTWVTNWLDPAVVIIAVAVLDYARNLGCPERPRAERPWRQRPRRKTRHLPLPVLPLPEAT